MTLKQPIKWTIALIACLTLNGCGQPNYSTAVNESQLTHHREHVDPANTPQLKNEATDFCLTPQERTADNKELAALFKCTPPNWNKPLWPPFSQ